MEWIRNNFATLEERQKSIPGSLYDIPDYVSTTTALPKITNLSLMANRISEYLIGKKIVIVGDYDVDGIMSTGIMLKTLKFLCDAASKVSGKPASFIDFMIPDRENDGYGFNEKQASQITDSVIILLDNGIVQYEAIRIAKANRNTVFVVDHHQPGGTMPDADLIVNPHAVSGGAFNEYCASGLSYRLAREIFSQPWVSAFVVEGPVKALLEELLFMAAVATVADVVPVLNENRVIIKEGMKTIPPHWENICFCLMNTKKKSLNEGDIAYKIAPAINALSRMGRLDKAILEELFFADDTAHVADTMQSLNVLRKECTEKAMKSLEIPDKSAKVLVVQSENVSHGIAGIIAGRLCDKEAKPVFMFGPEQDGLITGSARAVKGTVHLKNLLDKVGEKIPGLLEKYGGHESAAGVTIRRDRLDEFNKAVNEISDYAPITTMVYDFELPENNWQGVYKAIQEYAPYGEGNPSPMLHFRCEPDPKEIVIMKREHLKVLQGNNECVVFGLAHKYNPAQEGSLDLYGTLQLNEYRGGLSIQFNAIDVKQKEPSKNNFQMELDAALAAM